MKDKIASQYDAYIAASASQFEEITGLKCFFLRLEAAMTAFTANPGCKYCERIQGTYDGLYKCSRQRQMAVQEAIKSGTTKILRCHAGLVELIVPLRIENEVLGFFCTGFVAEATAAENLRRQKNYFSVRYGIDEKELLSLVNNLRVESTGGIETMMHLFSDLLLYHFQEFDTEHSNGGFSPALPSPEDYYSSISPDNPLKHMEHATYREMIASARENGGSKAVWQLRQELSLQQDYFCTCVAEGRTVEAKEVYLHVLAPAYMEKEVDRCAYEVYKRMSRITKRLHDYFGYNDELDNGKFGIFQGMIQAGSVKEVRLFSNDFFQLVINCFGYMSRQKAISLYENAREFINRNCSSQLKVNDVASALGVTPDYLNRVFKAKQTISIKQYMTLVLIDRIKALLESTDWSIEAISVNLKFSDVRGLYRIFSANVGMTCGEYRKLYRRRQLPSQQDGTFE